MDNSRDMILHLYQDVPYRIALRTGEDRETSCAQGYDYLLAILDNQGGGTDSCLFCKAEPVDEILHKSCDGIFMNSPGDAREPLSAIPHGTYRFIQLPFTPMEGSGIEPLVGQCLFSKTSGKEHTGRFYIRLLKENLFETVVQLFIPVAGV